MYVKKKATNDQAVRVGSVQSGECSVEVPQITGTIDPKRGLRVSPGAGAGSTIIQPKIVLKVEESEEEDVLASSKTGLAKKNRGRHEDEYLRGRDAATEGQGMEWCQSITAASADGQNCHERSIGEFRCDCGARKCTALCDCDSSAVQFYSAADIMRSSKGKWLDGKERVLRSMPMASFSHECAHPWRERYRRRWERTSLQAHLHAEGGGRGDAHESVGGGAQPRLEEESDDLSSSS
ncbi:MAG: hypothetical protein P4M11_03830 [Candidatus Pacebacteria bacterium]|nr:hypothetical protein [Candidatus Paceibacterota bacterium]